MPSSGGQFWGWCPSCKIRGPPPPGMSQRHPSSSCGVGAHTGGWSRYAPPHPFKVKLGDHSSAAPEITPGWELAPGCGTHGTPLRCRSELVGLPRQYTTISATMKRSAVPRPRPSCNSRRQNSPGNSRRPLANSVAAYADWKEPAAQENGNTPKETTKGPRLGPTISRRSQR